MLDERIVNWMCKICCLGYMLNFSILGGKKKLKMLIYLATFSPKQKIWKHYFCRYFKVSKVVWCTCFGLPIELWFRYLGNRVVWLLLYKRGQLFPNFLVTLDGSKATISYTTVEMSVATDTQSSSATFSPQWVLAWAKKNLPYIFTVLYVLQNLLNLWTNTHLWNDILPRSSYWICNNIDLWSFVLQFNYFWINWLFITGMPQKVL